MDTEKSQASVTDRSSELRSRVLDDFVNALPADATFYANLASKRAIPQTWAEKMRLKPLTAVSARDAIAHVSEQHGRNALSEAGLLNADGNIPGALLADNTLIPYLDHDGHVQKIRPHKMGLPGDPIAVYSPFILAETKASEIVLTEGEFKAIAACAAGFPCLAVPGISSFVGAHYPELRDLLKRHGIRSVTICFDNTDAPKADPAYPSGRDDTNFYAVLLAKMLSEDGF